MNVEGISAIVTGGGSGLGAATARHLAELGARVTIIDVNATLGAGVAAEVGGLFALADVTDEKQVHVALSSAAAQHGVGRILVNCAGVSPQVLTTRSTGPHPMDAFRRTMEVNAVGSYLVLSRFAHRLRQGKPIGEERGVIVNVTSIAAHDGQAGLAAYSASKGAVAAMTVPVMLDLAPYAIRVVAIAPGLFDTPMLANVPGPPSNRGAQTPHPPRLGAPNEFAQLVAHVISNPMINGETIRIDGGLRLAPQ
jgi:NAD(P)-dependent dehydrogenase (short-subunit alcohol dehydrogenase family)